MRLARTAGAGHLVRRPAGSDHVAFFRVDDDDLGRLRRAIHPGNK